MSGKLHLAVGWEMNRTERARVEERDDGREFQGLRDG